MRNDTTFLFGKEDVRIQKEAQHPRDRRRTLEIPKENRTWVFIQCLSVSVLSLLACRTQEKPEGISEVKV